MESLFAIMKTKTSWLVVLLAQWRRKQMFEQQERKKKSAPLSSPDISDLSRKRFYIERRRTLINSGGCNKVDVVEFEENRKSTTINPSRN